MVAIEREIDWKYVDVNFFNKEHLKDFSVLDVRKMFQREEYPMVPELAYLAFLINSPWGVDFNIERGVQRMVMDLRLPLFEGKGISWRELEMNPKKIWATQDSLDEDTLDMVRAGYKYMQKTSKPFPPVAIWKVTSTGSMHNYVAHDGHHRIFVSNEMHLPISTILLEYWLDNRDDSLLARKLPFQQVNKYCVDLPVIKNTFTTM